MGVQLQACYPYAEKEKGMLISNGLHKLGSASGVCWRNGLIVDD